jgi:hypothetical protein
MTVQATTYDESRLAVLRREIRDRIRRGQSREALTSWLERQVGYTNAELRFAKLLIRTSESYSVQRYDAQLDADPARG